MNKSDFIFKPEEFNAYLDTPLRFNDIDILGHLNNIVYFSLFDTAKARYFETVRHGKMDFRHVETVIANVDCSFINSAFFGEPIRIYTRCEKMGTRSFTLRQVLVNSDTMDVKAICDTVMVTIDSEAHCSAPIPEASRLAIETFENKQFKSTPQES
jgi:acyl-CoA thioester hydrolase